MDSAFKTLKITLWTLPMAALVGSAVAFFLWALDRATETRFAHPGLLLLLPLIGIPMVAIYHHYGGRSAEGSNLVIDEIHKPGGGVPFRLMPLVLFSTVLTHLFGGSAGREGTAVQMGGSIAGDYAFRLKFSPESTRVLLMAGIAAGLGSVFGTPLAGAIFAMEVLTAGRIEYKYSLPCLASSFFAHFVCLAWGTHHGNYHIGVFSPASATTLDQLDWRLLLKVCAAAIAFGLAGRLFASASHWLSDALKRLFPRYWLRPVVGGLSVILLCYAIHTTDYLGLGVSNPDPSGITILSCFHQGGATPWSWLWKIIFTVLTLSSGFKGGEVTPLFFVGAALGNALAAAMGAPVDLLAGLGLVAVFAGATNTPLACTAMGIELFGGTYIFYLAVACFVARAVSGQVSVYRAQR